MEVRAGEVVALVGDNGAGKSTLVKILAGVHLPSSGTVEFCGKQVAIDSPGTALELGIATVFQDLALCENLDVVANLFLGHEMSPWGLDEVGMEVRAWTLLRELAARIPSVREPIASLSGGQRQTVAIARSLLLNPKIIGTAAKIHPVLVIFALFLGEYSYGLVGALLAVPILSAIQVVFMYFYRKRWKDAPRPQTGPMPKPVTDAQPLPPTRS